MSWSETIWGKDERSSTLPVPLTWKKLRPEGFDARWLRLISPPEVGVEEDDVVGRARERRHVREVNLAGGAGPVGTAGAWIVRLALVDTARLVTFGNATTAPPLANTESPLIDVSPAKLGDPLLTVIVSPVIEVSCPVGTVAVPSMVRSVRVSVVRSGSSRVPPVVTLSKECCPGRRRSGARPRGRARCRVPLTWKKLRPEGFDARWLRLISPPEEALKKMTLLVVPVSVVTCERSTSLGGARSRWCRWPGSWG